MSYMMIAFGLLLLFAGGESLVRGAVILSRAFGVSSLFVGVVVVGFGTSAPEFVVSLEAALIGEPGITVGNVIGSNIANILLILGTAAAIYPIASRLTRISWECLAVLSSSFLVIPLALIGVIEAWMGGLLLCLLLLVIVHSYRVQQRIYRQGVTDGQTQVEGEVGTGPSEADPLTGEAGVLLAERPLWQRIAIGLAASLAGLAMLIAGSHLLVEGAVVVARSYGIDEAVIGLTLVAVGTSLPELATGIVAAIRRHSDVALGNILGSNVFNVLGVLGATALVTPVPIPERIFAIDVWVMLGATLIIGALLWHSGRIGRVEGLVLLLAYGAYTASMYTGG